MVLAVQGRTLTNDQIFNAVDCAIQTGAVPYATNAVYLLLGASNIKASSGERLQCPCLGSVFQGQFLLNPLFC